MTTEQENKSTIGQTVSDAAGTIKDAATDAADRLPEVASATRSALVEVDRQVQAGTDEMLTIGSALSFGLASGLFIAGANRLLVMAAFVPAAVLGMAMLDRATRVRASAAGTTPRATGGAGRRLQGG